MNICFFSGEIVSDVSFNFIISKDKSFKKCRHFNICYFELSLSNKTTVKVKAYDELADFCYRNLKNRDYVFLYGCLNDRFEVEGSFLYNLIHT